MLETMQHQDNSWKIHPTLRLSQESEDALSLTASSFNVLSNRDKKLHRNLFFDAFTANQRPESGKSYIFCVS